MALVLYSDNWYCCSCGVSAFECKHAHKIAMGYQEFEVNQDDPNPLPRSPEWCRQCDKESAIPRFRITFNHRDGYALYCPHCHQEYPVYASAYKSKHLGGMSMSGKYIPPIKTSGLPQFLKLPEDMTEYDAHKYYRSFFERHPELIASTESIDEAIDRTMRWREERAEFRKEEADRRSVSLCNIENEKIEHESLSRKEMIRKGILKYKKVLVS